MAASTAVAGVALNPLPPKLICLINQFPGLEDFVVLDDEADDIMGVKNCGADRFGGVFPLLMAGDWLGVVYVDTRRPLESPELLR